MAKIAQSKSFWTKNGTVLYGGTHSTVTQQLHCEHHWYGPAIDKISRYYQCCHCYALFRDILETEFFEVIKDMEIILPNSIVEELT